VVVVRGAGGGEPTRSELVLPPGSSVTVDAVSVVDPAWEVTTDAPGLVASVAASGMAGPVQGVAAGGVSGDAGSRADVVGAWDPRAGA